MEELLEESLGYLQELLGEWSWKRGTTERNCKDVEELEELVGNIKQTLKGGE